MKTPRLLQQGIVTVLGLLFLSVVVIFILMQSLNMSGTKSLETQQHLDSIHALTLAENGREMAMAAITRDVNVNGISFSSSCNYASGTTTVSAGKSFTYKSTSTPSTATLCPVRVQGTSGTANRTIESWLNSNEVIGTGGYGNTISMSLNNTTGRAAVAIFNLAWRVSNSTGQNPPPTPPNASASTNCTGCISEWNLASTNGGGDNAVGSMGTARTVVKDESATVSLQTLSGPRNYSEVGLILGGFSESTAPSINGCYMDQQGTANTSSGSSSIAGYILGPKANSTCGPTNGDWCNGADTIVFGVSGRGANNIAASFNSLSLNGTPITTEPVTVPSWMAHYPNTNGSSPPIMKGDVFSEIWYRYNKRIADMTQGSSPATPTAPYTITVKNGDTVGLQKDMIVQVNRNNAGYFQPYTKVTNVIDGKTFQVDKPPAVQLDGTATICTGICALFSNPWDSSSNNKTPFTLTHDNNFVSQQWAGGWVCLSGVDPTKVRRISTSNIKVQKWHEVVSGE